MAKEVKASIEPKKKGDFGNGKPKMDIKSKGEKQKKDKKEESAKTDEPKAAQNESFSLFGGKADSQLDDVFSKGAAFAISTPTPVFNQPKAVEPSKVAAATTTDEVQDSGPSKKRRRRSSAALKALAVEGTASTDEAGPSRVKKQAAKAAKQVVEEEDEEEEDGDEDVDLVHESLKGTAKRQRRRKADKYIPDGETQEDRDRRTIFVGNLSLEVAKSKSGISQLRAHILSFVPGAKIESARLRSVPFATPTTGTGADDEAEGVKRAKREKERAKAWRAQQEVLKHGDKKEKEELDTAESFIDSKGKRKVAFIKKEFHTEADNCNAYVVFAYAPPDRPANLPPILDPFEAAQKAMAADGSVFLGHTIRVDVVRLASSQGLASATTNLKKRDAWTAGSDPKKSVFVGGLDYAAKDEDLRVFFEELVKKERGNKEDGGRYVESVRIVRDKQTQMGKGFAYVHFADAESVDEVLGLEATRLKFAKKQLRVQRARTLPAAIPKTKVQGGLANGAKPIQKPASKAPIKSTSVKQTPIGPVPKGNPLLGEKIKNLSKEDRKAAKSEDADRQARRLAKKKMRGKMGGEAEKGAVKLLPTKGEKAGRKKVVAKKSRVRSSNALAKMKGSRD